MGLTYVMKAVNVQQANSKQQQQQQRVSASKATVSNEE